MDPQWSGGRPRKFGPATRELICRIYEVLQDAADLPGVTHRQETEIVFLDTFGTNGVAGSGESGQPIGRLAGEHVRDPDEDAVGLLPSPYGGVKTEVVFDVTEVHQRETVQFVGAQPLGQHERPTHSRRKVSPPQVSNGSIWAARGEWRTGSTRCTCPMCAKVSGTR